MFAWKRVVEEVSMGIHHNISKIAKQFHLTPATKQMPNQPAADNNKTTRQFQTSPAGLQNPFIPNFPNQHNNPIPFVLQLHRTPHPVIAPLPANPSHHTQHPQHPNPVPKAANNHRLFLPKLAHHHPNQRLPKAQIRFGTKVMYQPNNLKTKGNEEITNSQ